MQQKKNIKLGKINLLILVILLTNILVSNAENDKIKEVKTSVEIKILDKVSSKNTILKLNLGEEKKVLNQLDNDPLLKLKADEVQLRAQDQQRKEKESEEKANMETLKLIRGGQEFDAKLQQDDDHAKLRASVSLAKDGIKQMKATVIDE
mgnify:CR=1 FL=1